MRHNNVNAVQRLLDEGLADVATADGTGATPLHWASLNRCKDVVKILLERGAPTDVPMHDGERFRPLHWACDGGM